MKKLFVILLILSTIQIFSQTKRKKFNFQIGGGPSIHNFYYNQITFETELNYYINKYFTTSFSFNYTKGDVFEIVYYEYFQPNLTLFISPFKNNRKNDFRLGYGISELFFINLTNDKKIHKTGHNIVIEDNYKIKNKYIIGLKLFGQTYLHSKREGYEHGDFGGLLKIGVIF
ncbi:MAG: hypothetical protein L3J35_06620 [Bacteroidales bacterium]|nr:hypothetical protein [Bacteroidales bacterium]